MLRRAPQEGMRIANNVVTVEAAPPAARISVRATAKGAASLGKTLGLSLPQKPSTSASKQGLHSLWLGPDEWLVFDEKRAVEDIMPKRSSKEFSVVDISHRNAAFMVSGQGAANALNAACPRDLALSSFPIGACSRTILGKAEVVIYRLKRDVFRVECWRSFVPYMWDLLKEGAKDAHI